MCTLKAFLCARFFNKKKDEHARFKAKSQTKNEEIDNLPYL